MTTAGERVWRMTVNLLPSERRRLRLAAARADRSVSDWVRELIERTLSQEEAEGEEEGPDDGL